MIKPNVFPKIRLINLYRLGYKSYWNNWAHIKINITPRIERFWKNHIINLSIAGYGISLDFRRGNLIDQMRADNIVRDLHKN